MKKKRNPVAMALLINPIFRSKIEKSVFEKQNKQNKWSRQAKHKKPSKDNLDGFFI